jgi:hypothetical protein
MNTMKRYLPLILILLFACSKSSVDTYYPDTIQGNWAVISRYSFSYNYVSPGLVYTQSYMHFDHGSDSLSVNFQNHQYNFSYLAGGNTGFIFYTGPVPTIYQVYLRQDQGYYRVINDSELIIQPDTSALLKYCNSLETNPQNFSIPDTLHYKRNSADSLTISQQIIIPNQTKIGTTTGFRRM